MENHTQMVAFKEFCKTLLSNIPYNYTLEATINHSAIAVCRFVLSALHMCQQNDISE